MELYIKILIFVVLVVISGFFAAAEVSLLSISRLRVKHLLSQKKREAEYIRLLKEDPDRLLSTVLIGNNLANVTASVMATVIAFDLFGDYAISIATGATTILLLVFGDIAPKSFATKYTERFAFFVAKPIWGLSIIFYPGIKVLKFLMGPLNPKKIDPIITVDELKTYVEAGHEIGSIKELEKKMIHRIFEFDQISIKEIMTPKLEMVMVNANDKISKAIHMPAKKLYSRLPIYSKRKDNIVGVFNVKDALRNFDKKRLNDRVKEYMRKPILVPETLKIDRLLRLFQKKNEHMAIVVNEHGSITGLVTIENVLEEIVGNIRDESDSIDMNIRQIDENFWYIKGRTSLEEMKEKIGFKIDAPVDFDTFNGFIIQKLGRLPREGEDILYDGFKIRVEEIKGYRVELTGVLKIKDKDTVKEIRTPLKT